MEVSAHSYNPTGFLVETPPYLLGPLAQCACDTEPTPPPGTVSAIASAKSTDFIGAVRHPVPALSAYAYQEASSLVPAFKSNHQRRARISAGFQPIGARTLGSSFVPPRSGRPAPAVDRPRSIRPSPVRSAPSHLHAITAPVEHLAPVLPAPLVALHLLHVIPLCWRRVDLSGQGATGSAPLRLSGTALLHLVPARCGRTTAAAFGHYVAGHHQTP